MFEAKESREISNNWSGPVEGENERKHIDQSSEEDGEGDDNDNDGNEREVMLQAVSMHDDVKTKIAEALTESNAINSLFLGSEEASNQKSNVINTQSTPTVHEVVKD